MSGPISLKRCVLGEYVDTGMPPASAFRFEDGQLDPAELPQGGVILKLLWLSVDPYMRPLFANPDSLKNHYTSGFKLGEPITSGAIGCVIASKSDAWAEGDLLTGRLPWATHQVLAAEALQACRKVDAAGAAGLPLSYFLGVLGMPGLTAYASLKKIGRPQKGETVLVSAAAGAVGQVVCQMCKNVYGCRVVGSVGSGDKVKLLQDLGVDAAFNYKTESYEQALAAHCPDGIDVDYENVGGEALDAAIAHMNKHGRVVACGAVSQYNLPQSERYGVKNFFQVVGKQLLIQGFIVSDLAKGLEKEFVADMATWIKEGKVKPVEHVTEGFENAGRAFIGMMGGDNIGKAVVKVAKDEGAAPAGK